MLKRSFAEFHAQRTAPAGAAELAAVEAELAAAAAAAWPATALGCGREEVEAYADVCEAIERLSGQLQVGEEARGREGGAREGLQGYNIGKGGRVGWGSGGVRGRVYGGEWGSDGSGSRPWET